MLNQWQAILICAAVLLLCLRLWSAVKRSRERKARDAQRRLELILQPRETVKYICPQRDGRCILTSERVIFDRRSGIHAVTVRSIQQLQGYTALGKKTTVPAKMAKLTIQARQEYTIDNTGEEFLELVKPLQEKVKKQNEKKKLQKEAQERKEGND